MNALDTDSEVAEAAGDGDGFDNADDCYLRAITWIKNENRSLVIKHRV